MFSVHCQGHAAEVLLPESHITKLHNTLDGIEVHWRCWCGSTGAFLTGRTTRPRLRPAV